MTTSVIPHSDHPNPALRALHALRDWALGRRGRVRQVLLWLVVLLVVARILAPYVLTMLANSALAAPGPVRGSIAGISLSLLSGGYSVHGLHLETQPPGKATWAPLLDIPAIHCSFDIAPALAGNLVGQVRIVEPVLRTTAAAEGPSSAEEEVEPDQPRVTDARGPTREPWQERVRSIIRLHLTQVEIVDGKVIHSDEARGITAALEDIDCVVDDLIVEPGSEAHRATYRLTGRTPGHGQLLIEGDADPLAPAPTFLARARLEDVRLPELNDLTRSFDNLTFGNGTFSGYAEIVADGRKVGGYLKVLFRELDIASFRDAKSGDGTTSFWKVAINAAEEVLENEDQKQHGARIPVSGSLEDPGVSVWATIGSTLHNAFVRALIPGFESRRTG
jgi:hypothetical protein